jgi:hypothetical protein
MEQVTEHREPIAREGEHVPPMFESKAFHCPLCGVLAGQSWWQLQYEGGRYIGAFLSRCGNCQDDLYWVRLRDGSDAVRIADPLVGGGPRPHVQTPENVRGDYEEARAIVMQSPRGACALLRLAAQKLADDLIEGNGDLNSKIATLVSQGLSVDVAQALDALRVVGNNAVHPREMVLDDDIATATALFECLNLIVEDRVARPRRVAELFDKLPQGARDAITQRDLA